MRGTILTLLINFVFSELWQVTAAFKKVPGIYYFFIFDSGAAFGVELPLNLSVSFLSSIYLFLSTCHATFTLPGAVLGSGVLQYGDYICARCMVGFTGILSADA